MCTLPKAQEAFLDDVNLEKKQKVHPRESAAERFFYRVKKLYPANPSGWLIAPRCAS
jgi:hypothetical protein